MMEDCIEIIDDDDDEVEIIDVIVNLEPKHRIIDLTDCEDAPSQDARAETEDENEDRHNPTTEQAGTNGHFRSQSQKSWNNGEEWRDEERWQDPKTQSDRNFCQSQESETEMDEDDEKEAQNQDDDLSNQTEDQRPEPPPEPEFEPTPEPEQTTTFMPRQTSDQQESQTPTQPLYKTQQPHQRSPFNAPPHDPSPVFKQKSLEEQQLPGQSESTTNSNVPPKPPIDKHKLMMDLKNLGNEKYRKNLFDDALRSYNRANELASELREDEMSSIIHFNLAMTRYKLGDFNKAADECAMATKLNDRYMKAHLKRAEIYQRLGKFEEAVICYEHICELDSENPDYITLLKTAREAVKRLKKPDHYHLLGVRYNYTEEELKKAYKKLAKLHHPDRHSNVDVVSRRIQEKIYKEVLEAYNQLLALHSRCSFWRQ